MSKRIFIIGFFISVFALLPTVSKASCANIIASFSTSTTEICGAVPTTITFTNLTSGVNARTSGYQWYLNGTLFGSTTDTNNTPTSTISAIGVYTYMLVGYDTLGVCRDTAYQTVTIVQSPTANFSFPAGSFCPNDVIPFTNLSSGLTANTRYLWQFGNIGSDTSVNPNFVFGRGGTITVSLTVYNSLSCSNIISQNITILNTPTLNVFGDDGDGDIINCVSPFDTITRELVTFVNNSDSLITYTWDFGDGTPPVTQNYASAPDTITHLFTSFGTFPVVVSAIAPNGCLYTDTLFVVFDKFISASFTVPISQISGCTPHLVVPTNASVNATRYRWDFGDGTPPITTTNFAPPTHTYDSTGTYTITLTASNDCNSSVSTVGPIIVTSSPEIDFSFDLVGRGCSPQLINFTNLSQMISPVTNYTWVMDNGNVYNGVPPPQQTYLIGDYSVKLIGANGCGSDSLVQTFSVDSLPYALVTVLSDEGCSPMTVNASAVEFGYGTLSRWFVDGVQVAFGNTMPTELFTNTSTTIQTHTIRYSISNHCGTYDTTITVVVHPSVQAVLNNTASPICSGTSLTHRSLSTGDSLFYQWYFGDGTTSNTVGPHVKTYTKSGLDSVKLVVTGYCGVDSVTKLITVDSLPYARTSVSPLDGCSPLMVSGNSIPFGSGTTSSWYKNSVYHSAGDSLFATPFTNTGTTLLNRSIRFNITNLCGSFDTTYTITIHPDVDARLTPNNALVCIGDSLLFRNVSNGDSLSFLWRFGDGTSSTLNGPHSKRFTTQGRDTTQLIVTGFCGVDSVSTITTINPFPVARIIADKLNGCEDLRVNFTNGAPNGSSYNWRFSGGFPLSSSSYIPSVLFTTPGPNQVILEVDSLGCLSSDTTIIDVYPGPDPLFTHSPISGCSDLIVGITNNSAIALGDTYKWEFENGLTDTNYTPPSQVFVNSSNTVDSIYSIKLIIFTANGCKDSTIKNVTVHPLPSAVFSTSDTNVCEKETVFFTNNSVGATSYKWYFGDGDSSLITNPSHLYDTTGVYTVTLITSSFWNCKDTSYQIIVVNPNPIVRFYSDSVCLTYITSFTDSSLLSPVSWKWFFGDGDSSTLQNPTHLYLTDSTFPVRFEVINSFGCFGFTNKPVIVYTQPVAGFTSSAACPKRITSFTDTSSGTPTKWSWDFGDGNIDSVKNPTHVYSVGGLYTVTLIVENASGCIDTISKPLLISTIPRTRFVADSVCIGYPTSFVDSSVLSYPILSHFWDFGDGNNSILPNPSYQYLNPGTYYVSLTVTNINGCDSTYSDSVIVYPGPFPSFTYAPISGCSDLIVSTTNSSPVTAGDTYLWRFGNGNSDTSYTPPTQTFVNTSNVSDTIYPIQLIISTAFGCQDSLSQTVTVHPLPLSLFVPSKKVVCEKESLSFSNSSVGGNSYKWFFGDGDSSYFANPSHSYDTAGTYIVSLITSSFWNCTDTSYDTIVVNPNPVVIFYSDSACLTFITTFSDSSLYSPSSWKWFFGDGDSSSLQHPTHLYGNDTTYSVTLNVTNIYGCSSSATKNTIVHTQPVAGFDISIACAKKNTFFTDTSSGNPVKWYWDFGDGNIDSVKNPTHVYLLGGTYSVMLIVENASGCIDTIIKPVVISTVPQTYFTVDSVCVGGPTGFTNLTTFSYPIASYFWSFGDGNSSSLINPNYQYLNPGTYFVSLTVTNINGCDSTYSDSVIVYPVPTAIFTNDTICYLDSTSFLNSSLGSPTYSIWDYGDGSTLDTTNSSVVKHYYTSAGSYLVKLVVINQDGCRDSLIKTILVHPRAVASFTPQKDSVCFSDSITFLNSSLGGNSYTWSFGDGNTSNLTNPTHTYLASGMFQVKLTVTNPFGCLDSVVDSVDVLTNPIADFTADTVCFTSPTRYVNLSTGNALSWSWDFGDGNSDTSRNPSHTYSFDSTFTTTLIVRTPFGCSDTVTKTVLVLPIVDAQFNYSLACVTRPINFTDSSLGSPNSWYWDFGDGNSSALQNPTHTYAISGNYLVRLIVVNAAGCSDTITKTVFVNTIPVPNFTVDTVCFGNITSFTNLSTNSQPITTYFWDYGDGNSSFGINPSYTYSAPGIYTVTLTVTNNGGCDSSITKSILVRAVPVANFTHDTVCAGLGTTFTDISSGSPTSWKWNFGDFSPIDSTTGPIVTHNYPAAGQYTASLIVKSGANNCTSQAIKFITVLGGVDADFSVSSPICDGTAVQFVNNSTATSGGIVSTSWSLGDGTLSSLNNPSHLYSGPGVYKVTLSVVSSLGCIDSDSSNVVVNSKPVSNFGYVQNICLGNPTPFTDSSTIGIGTITGWNWNFGDGNTDTLQNPVNTYASAGVYLVTLQVTSDSGCTDVSSTLITINPESDVNFSYTPVCVGDTMKFKDLTTIAPPDSIVSWFWEFGDGSTSSVQNASHVYATNTQSYLVRLTVTSFFGCVNDTTILVSHFPVPSFNFGPEYFAYCENDLVQFYDSSTIALPSSIVGWEWTYGNGHNSFIQNPSHMFDSAGSYYLKLKLTSSDGCIFYDSLAAPLIIYPNPVADFDPIPGEVSVFRPEVYFDNKSTGSVSYVWKFGDGDSSTVAFPTHIFPNVVGYYTTNLYAYSSFGCVDSVSKTIYVKDEFTLYAPNAFTPNKDFNNVFNVVGYQLNNFSLKIFNRWGELLFETTNENEGWNGKHNGKECQPGVYVYQITARDPQRNDHSKTGHVTLVR